MPKFNWLTGRLGDDKMSTDSRDVLRELEDMPSIEPGAPIPVVLSNDDMTFLAYVIAEPDPDWDGTPRSLTPDSGGTPVAVVRFEHCRALYFGAPNDEALAGHPLAARGLEPYTAFEVQESSWVDRLEGMNRVHPMHSATLFEDCRHFIFTFHDSTFECVANSYAISKSQGSMIEILERLPGEFRSEGLEA